MLNRTVIYIFLSCLIAMTWSTQQVVADDDGAVAILDGVAITQRQVDGSLANAQSATQIEKRAALEKIISQELMAGQARREKLDQSPAVIAAIASAKRQILAQAYLDDRAKGVAKPTPEAIRSYYDEHPALFSERAIYDLQAISIKADGAQLGAVMEQYSKIKTLEDMVTWLSANNVQHESNVAAMPAEALPGDFLGPVASLQKGQVIKVDTDFGVSIFQLIGKRSEPISFVDARSSIEAALINQALGEHIRQAVSELRSKAAIEIFPPFAPAP